MTAAVYRSGTPALSIPENQNTAPVLEFNCLYTHDIRRKQKRWQDGFLRFHTFNKRVMVYDVPRNFIGDTHWKSGEDLQDGDEVTLEKGGVIVQVAESIGRTETDLTGLRQSKNKRSNEHGSSPAQAPRPRPSVSNSAAPTPSLGLRHRSLNALLSTPKGPIGKAMLPPRSPFEERQANSVHRDVNVDRPAKRQRLEEPAAWNVVRTAKPAISQPENKEVPLWARTADSTKKKRKSRLEPGQRALVTKEVIDLSEEIDEPPDRFLPGFSSDALAPSSPSQADVPCEKAVRPAISASSPAFQTQKLSARVSEAAANPLQESPEKRQTLKSQRRTTDSLEANEHAPAEFMRTRTTENDHTDMQVPQVSHINGSRMAEVDSRREKPSRTLRIATSAPKKKMLLCQDQLSTKDSRSQTTRNPSDTGLDGPPVATKVPTKQAKSHREQLQDRLAKIAAKNDDKRDSPILDPAEGDQNQYDITTEGTTAATRHEPHLRPVTPLEQNAFELAQLDQMIMPPARSPSPVAAPAPRESKQLRRVVSEANASPDVRSKRVPGAPVRYTPSPVKKVPSAAPSVAPSDPEASPARKINALPTKGRSKKSLQRAVSLNTTSNGTSTVILSKPFQTPKAPMSKVAVEPARAPDPWSREAFDLFTWRPPGWDEEKWCLKQDAAA